MAPNLPTESPQSPPALCCPKLLSRGIRENLEDTATYLMRVNRAGRLSPGESRSAVHGATWRRIAAQHSPLQAGWRGGKNPTETWTKHTHPFGVLSTACPSLSCQITRFPDSRHTVSVPSPVSKYELKITYGSGTAVAPLRSGCPV